MRKQSLWLIYSSFKLDQICGVEAAIMHWGWSPWLANNQNIAKVPQKLCLSPQTWMFVVEICQTFTSSVFQHENLELSWDYNSYSALCLENKQVNQRRWQRNKWGRKRNKQGKIDRASKWLLWQPYSQPPSQLWQQGESSTHCHHCCGCYWKLGFPSLSSPSLTLSQAAKPWLKFRVNQKITFLNGTDRKYSFMTTPSLQRACWRYTPVFSLQVAWSTFLRLLFLHNYLVKGLVYACCGGPWGRPVPMFIVHTCMVIFHVLVHPLAALAMNNTAKLLV